MRGICPTLTRAGPVYSNSPSSSGSRHATCHPAVQWATYGKIYHGNEGPGCANSTPGLLQHPDTYFVYQVERLCTKNGTDSCQPKGSRATVMKERNMTGRKEGQGRKKEENLPVIQKQKGPVEVTCKLWNDLDLVKAGVDKDKIDKKPNRVLASLWQQLKPEHQFQPIMTSTVRTLEWTPSAGRVPWALPRADALLG